MIADVWVFTNRTVQKTVLCTLLAYMLYITAFCPCDITLCCHVKPFYACMVAVLAYVFAINGITLTPMC